MKVLTLGLFALSVSVTSASAQTVMNYGECWTAALK